MNYITFNISGNIDYFFINEFIGFYRNSIKDEAYLLKFTFNDKINEKIEGEVDPVFLNYLILFLDDHPLSKLIFEFSDLKNSSRAFSLKIQLEYIVNLLNLNKNQIVLKANYITIHGEIKRINFATELKSSKRFTPPIFLKDKESLNFYFGGGGRVNTPFLKKMEDTILKKLTLERKDISNLSIVELYLLSLITSDDVIIEQKINSKQNKAKIKTPEYQDLYEYVHFLSKGLQEIASNFLEHSSSKKGILSFRIYQKTKLIELKEESFLPFFKSREESFFLDINIIDFGEFSIKESYLQKLKENQSQFSFLKEFNFKNERDNIKKFELKDFFTINLYNYTNRQENNLIRREGLHSFTQIIKNQYNGFIKGSSNSEEFIMYDENGKDIVRNFSNTSKNGTTYNCIIPLTVFNKLQTKREEQKKIEKSAQKINLLKQLIKLDKVNYDTAISSKINNQIINYRPKKIQTSIESKYLSIVSAYIDLIKIRTEYRNNILAIDGQNFQTENESDWIRLLSALAFDFKNIIVYNIKSEIANNIIERRKLYSDTIFRFWNNTSQILFYSIRNDESKLYEKFEASILTGETFEHCFFLNKVIARNHFSLLDNSLEFKGTPKGEILNIPENSFFKNGVLLFFELILTTKDKFKSEVTLFEKSLQYVLNEPIYEEDENINSVGYKIKNTHFKLGSKIHIEDFFYGKRLFQNSFYTTPIAFLIAKNIALNIKNENYKDGITLIGYEDYSDYLVSNIVNILSEFVKFPLNHCSIDKEGTLSRNVDFFINILIIVPIASTFSTSLKIKNQIKLMETGREKFNFISPFYNIILVGNSNENGSFEEDVVFSDNEYLEFNENSILKINNWQSIDLISKKVKLSGKYNYHIGKGADENDYTIQKYFVPVYTKWHNSNDCELCFIETKEKCIIETGPASITPKLIFDLPKIKPSKNNNLLNLKNSLIYGNLRNGRNSYLYFTSTSKILSNKTNLSNVINWLRSEIKPIFDKEILDGKKLVIVTPYSNSKSIFLDLVVDNVFEFAANCLTISLKEDYIENAELLYKEGFKNADVIIYVDDVLSTIKSFLEINYVVKSIRNKLDSGRGIDYCISLINKMSFEYEENLLLKLFPLDLRTTTTYNTSNQLDSKIVSSNNTDTILDSSFTTPPKTSNPLDKLHYFIKYNTPSIEEPNSEFPLLKEIKRYKNLSKSSSLDSIRLLFRKKQLKLNTINISDAESVDYDSSEKNQRKLFQYLVLNAIYTIFEYKDGKRNDQIKAFFSESESSFSLLQDGVLNILAKDNYHFDVISKYKHNLDCIILKILCSTPLIYYKRIRTTSFYWINLELKKILSDLESLTEQNIMHFFEIKESEIYSKYQKLKFLIKRSVKLNINFILQKRFIISIRNLLYFLKLQNEKGSSHSNDYNSYFELFKETNLPKGKLVLYEILKNHDEILKYNSREDSQLSNFLNGIDLELLKKEVDGYYFNVDGLKQKNETAKFNKSLSNLNPLKIHKFPTPKKIIYQIVALIQELIEDHETKEIFLEETIEKIIKKENLDIIKNCQNGNFEHFLRLLLMENTNSINKFANYSKNIHNQRLQSDQSFKTIEPLLPNNISSVQNFFILNNKFDEWIGNNDKINITQAVKEILEDAIKIISDDPGHFGAFFSVNFNNIQNPEPNDIYIFDKLTIDDDFLNPFGDNSISIANSIMLKMFHGIKIDEKDELDYTISNFEIIKENSTMVNYRDINTINRIDITKSMEVNYLYEKETGNIFFLRISDFQSDTGSNVKNNLLTKAVLVFFLKDGVRIDIKKIRLLLLLRNPIRKFLKEVANNNTFIELVKNKEKERIQSGLKHDLEDYLSYQQQIFKLEVGNSKSKNEIIFNILNSSIRAHIIDYDKNNNYKIEDANKKFLENFIETIFESKFLGKSSRSRNNYSLEINFEKKDFDYFILYLVIPELIINMKKHSPRTGHLGNITFKENEMIFENNKKPYSNKKNVSSKTGGLQMCEDVCKENNVKMKVVENSEVIFKVIIRI